MWGSFLSRVRGLLTAMAVAAVVAGGAVGCGASDDPTEEVPALSDRLTEVEIAIAEEDYRAARRAIDELVRTTTEALEAGDVEADQADAIVAAASRLEAQLPQDSGGTPAESEPADGATSPSTTQTSEPETDPDDGDDGENGEGSDKEDKNGDGKGKKKGSGKGKGRD